MGQEGDDIFSLPAPPPPRPAARREAIQTALRKFDGIEDAPAERAARERPISWSTVYRRPAGAFATVALIAIISIPAIQIALRDRPAAEAPPATESITAQPGQPPSLPEPGQPQADEAVAANVSSAEPAAASPSALPSAAAQERSGFAPSDRNEKAGIVAPAPMMAAPAPPPLVAAPPPLPPPPAESQAQMDAEGAGRIVVTGSRISRPNLESASPVTVIGDPSGEFLSRLQAGLGANDRRSIVGLIGLPLRVNFGSESRTYRSRQDLERDFDRIFTPAVRQAVLNLRPGALMSRDGGRLKGNGRLWFGCARKSCPSEDSIRIRAVTP